VPYLQLLDAHRASAPAPAKPLDAPLNRLIGLRRLRPALRIALILLRAVRPALLLASARLRLRRLQRLLSLAPQHVRLRAPARTPQADLQLFAGCMGDLGNASAIQSFLRVCQALGLRVDTLPAGFCCGALNQHRGDMPRCDTQQQELLSARKESLPLVALDSACLSQLRDAGWSDVHEACSFLNTQDWSGVALQALNDAVLIHEPCSHRHGLREAGAAHHLLQRIPGLTMQNLSDSYCCGAAGSHMLEFPDRADALLAPKLVQCQDSQAQHLVTTNIGCALHFAGGLRRSRLQTPGQLPTVCHPIELLDRQIHVKPHTPIHKCAHKPAHK
jgi:glycolate oxidase iron-sulfur subunit